MLDERVDDKKQWRDLVDVTKDQWIMMLEDEHIFTKKDIQLLEQIYLCDGEATASQLAQLFHMPHHAPLNSQVGQLGKRIVRLLGISAPRQKHGEGYDWWHVPFLGEARKEGYYWILRPELKEAMQEVDVEAGYLPEMNMPEEIDTERNKKLYEGAVKQIYVNVYERNRGVRDQCVTYYGTTCAICEFDFEKIYGDVGRDVIHVHHLKPLSDIGETYQIDPIKDLRPVCPNCHVIIHKRNPPYSIGEVIEMRRSIKFE